MVYSILESREILEERTVDTTPMGEKPILCDEVYIRVYDVDS